MNIIDNRKKFICIQCNIPHVTCNFGGADLHSDKLICLFCKISSDNLIKIDALKERVYTLEQKVAILENNPQSGHINTSNAKYDAKNNDKIESLNKRISKIEDKVENNFTMVKNRAKRAVKVDSFILSTKNKYDLLSENEDETIHDSLVRDQGVHFTRKNKKANRKVHCYGGINIKGDIEVVKKNNNCQ